MMIEKIFSIHWKFWVSFNKNDFVAYNVRDLKSSVESLWTFGKNRFVYTIIMEILSLYCSV